jgi:hypothetical protein
LARKVHLSRRAQVLAVTLFAVAAFLSPAFLTLASADDKSSPSSPSKADGTASETRANTMRSSPSGQGARRGAFAVEQSLCDVAPPCPKGCREDAAGRTCVEALPAAR